MSKYKMLVTEKHYYQVTVQADSVAAAREKARQDHMDGVSVEYDDDTEIVDIDVEFVS